MEEVGIDTFVELEDVSFVCLLLFSSLDEIQYNNRDRDDTRGRGGRGHEYFTEANAEQRRKAREEIYKARRGD